MDTKHTPKRDFAELEARRMQAGRMFEEGASQADVARLLGVSRQTASRWFETWDQKGKKGLKAAGRAGRKPKLAPEKRRKIAEALLKGPEHYGYATQLWTLERIAQVIKKICHVEYHPGHVWRILGQLGWSCQRPETRARERDEGRIRNWIRYAWPNVKKKSGDCGHA